MINIYKVQMLLFRCVFVFYYAGYYLEPYYLLKNKFNGLGGKLGTIAFIGTGITYYLWKLL